MSSKKQKDKVEEGRETKEGVEGKKRKNNAEKKEERAEVSEKEARGVSVPPGDTRVKETATETKAASVSGYAGFSEAKYKGGFASKVKSFAFG